jgi:phage terminase small subunit
MAHPAFRSEKELAFVDHYVRTGDARVAATRAGYSDSSSGYHVLARPAVREILLQRLNQIETEELRVLVLATAIRIMKDENATKREQLQAAELGRKILADKQGAGAQDKPISEMTPEELDAALRQALHRRAEAARPVLELSAAPIEPAQTIDESDPFA